MPKSLVPDDVFDDVDIIEALQNLGSHQSRSSREKWRALEIQMSSLSSALSSELGDFAPRFRKALDSEHHVQALRDIYDLGESIVNGVLALLRAIAETYLEDFDHAQLLPGRHAFSQSMST